MDAPVSIAVLTFLIAALSMSALYFAFTASKESMKSEVRRRLQTIAVNQPTEEEMPTYLKREVMSDIPLVNRMLFRVPLALKAENLLDQADVKMKVGMYFVLTLISACAGLALGMLLGRGLPLALMTASVLGSLPTLYLLRKKQARIHKFTEQFPDTLDMIARSLRAGHSITSAMYVVSQEMPDPVSKVFRVAYDEQTLGLSLMESLSNMTNRIDSLDLSFFVTAVNIQREAGGNLAEILEKLGVTIRERFRILGQLRVYTAQGRLSGVILGILPVALAMILWMMNPGYLKVLILTRVGVYMLVTAVALQVIGALIIRKIIRIQI